MQSILSFCLSPGKSNGFSYGLHLVNLMLKCSMQNWSCIKPNICVTTTTKTPWTHPNLSKQTQISNENNKEIRQKFEGYMCIYEVNIREVAYYKNVFKKNKFASKSRLFLSGPNCLYSLYGFLKVDCIFASYAQSPVF